MTNIISVDEIISKLSSKFNKIFYDREFVECVCQDFKTIIRNKNKCCVLVFPALSPNYLRVVRYQAKLFDLAVIALGSGSARSVGVCHKKYFLPNPSEPEESSKIEGQCKKQMDENAASSTRRKRPPIQLYVPPAQRKSRLSEKSYTQKDHTKSEKSRLEKEKSGPRLINSARKGKSEIKSEKTVFESVSTENKSLCNIKNDEIKNDPILRENFCSKEEQGELRNANDPQDFCSGIEDIEYLIPDKHFNFPFFSYQCNCTKLLLFKDKFPYAKLLVFSIKRIKHSFHLFRWSQKTKNLLVEDKWFRKWPIVEFQKHLLRNARKDTRVGLFKSRLLDFRENIYFSKEFSEFQNTYYLCGHCILFYLPKTNKCCYLPVPRCEVLDDELKPQNYLHYCQNSDNGLCYIEEFIKLIANCIILPPLSKTEDLDLDTLVSRSDSPQMPCEKDEAKCDNKNDDICAKTEYTNEISSSLNEKKMSKQIDQVIVLDHITPPKTGSVSPPRIKDKGKQNEHEQEKEIMRKAKQNINRRTRPIIKYVDDDNDTLNIGKGDSVNNWEELFNEDGELQEDIFTEIVHKVGPEVRIVKATEDYSAYAAKQIEELEHMVELYDFPSTLETHDLISAFTPLNSDSMYIKWVDDTRALLVLGSSTQAQKALEMSNSLIKVRPMSEASSLALEKAHHSDLKPAMKRPQTNLQTARRLITSHLGAKSKVSKEQSAKEREDLRVAKEMKKQARQNERDAWEGNIRSAIN